MPRLTNLAVEYVSLVDRAAVRDPANPSLPQRFLLTKSEVPVYDARGITNPGGNMPETETDLRDQLAKATKRAEKAERKLAKAEKVEKTDSGEAAALREQLAKAERDAKAVAKRAQDAEEIAKAERDLRVQREFVAKAEKEFPHLGDSATLGTELQRMSEKLDKADFDSHLERLAAANAQIDTGNLFAELGRAGDASGDQPHIAELHKAVADIRKADSGLSDYQARELALKRNPKLAAQLAAANR